MLLRVLYAIIQLAQGGEVFDFLSVTGRFSEPVARYYFRQLVEALDHCHSKGFAHRDLKPENLLFDVNFNLLLADFGFSTLMAGKDGSGKLKTILGTDNYMAPEIHSKNPYIGSSVDLFAAGIILFIFLTGHPPFNHAKATDSYYSLICMNNHEKFWHFHSRKKPNGAAFFSADFMNLINAMLAFDPTQRPSIAEIKSHSWYRGEVPTHEQVLAEFQQRKAKVEEENEKKKREIEARRQQRPAQGGAVFQGIQARFRSGNLKLEGEEDQVDDLAEVDSLPEIKLQRALPVLAESTKKRLNNYYSAFAPEDFIKVAYLTAQKKAKNVEFLAEDAKVVESDPDHLPSLRFGRVSDDRDEVLLGRVCDCARVQQEGRLHLRVRQVRPGGPLAAGQNRERHLRPRHRLTNFSNVNSCKSSH